MVDLKSDDTKRIDDAIRLGAPITIKTYSFSHLHLVHLSNTLHSLLNEPDLCGLRNILQFFLY